MTVQSENVWSKLMNQNNVKFFQVSTLQALALGFSKSVITVEELLKQGDTGHPGF